MEAKEIQSLSENDIMPDPVTEEPAPGTEPGETETPPAEDGQDPAVDPETPPREEKPGDNTGTPEPEASARDTGSGEGSISKEDLQELLDGINARFEQKDEAAADLTESIRSLVDLMSMDQVQQRDVYIPPDILIEGYEAWDYPVTVDYMISIVGYEDMLPQSASYDDPGQFLEDFQDLAWNCYRGDVFMDFYIDKAYDAGGNKVYDSQPEPEPGEEEPDETVELLLSHLEDINTTLDEMQQADLEYYQSVAAYQEETLELQTADTASTIILCIAVFAVLGELIIKHLLEAFR